MKNIIKIIQKYSFPVGLKTFGTPSHFRIKKNVNLYWVVGTRRTVYIKVVKTIFYKQSSNLKILVTFRSRGNDYLLLKSNRLVYK